MNWRQHMRVYILIGVSLALGMAGCSGGGGSSDGDGGGDGGGQQQMALATGFIRASSGGVVRVEAPHRLAGSAIEVPAGALASDTTIRIYEADRPAHARALNVAIEIEPAGLAFAVPALVRLVYDESALPEEAVEETLWLAKVASDGSLLALDAVLADALANEVSGETSSLSVFVAALNRAPVADAGLDQRVSLGAVARLDGDGSRDADGDALSYHWRLLSSPAGSASGLSDVMMSTASIETDAPGVYRVELIVDDGLAQSAPDEVLIATANKAPEAHDDVVIAVEDTPVRLSMLLGNDVDADGDALALSRFSQGSSGVVSANADGTLTYTPEANFNGVDEWIYWVSDGVLESASATVTVTVTPVNDAPVAASDAASVPEGGEIVIDALANDGDVDGDGLRVASVTPAAHGEVVNNGSSVTYRPSADYNGLDSFTYRASDGELESLAATVTITVTPVNNAPVAANDAASVLAGRETVIEVLNNDRDVDGDDLTVASVTAAAHGEVVNNGASVTYRPSANYSGPDSFTYRASDGAASSNTATVMITVSDAAAAPPNILLIMVDDMGYESVGVYGGISAKTPALDTLAAEGMRFEYAYSQPLCTPSRVKIMTGLFNFRNYVDWGKLEPGEATFARYLREQGYRTLLAGKWQLNERGGQSPWDEENGFDEVIIKRGTSSYEGNPYWGYPMVIYQDGKRTTIDDEQAFIPDLCAAFTRDFIQRHAQAKQPFFAYRPMHLPHSPEVCTPDQGSGPDDCSLSNQERYTAMVEYLDKEVGSLLQLLEELGIRQDTLVMLTSDNGAIGRLSFELSDGTIVQGGKGRTTDAGTRVPFIASWPGVIPMNVTNFNAIDFSVVTPTLLHAAIAPELPASAMQEQLRQFDGPSILDQLRGETGAPRGWVYSYYEPKRPSNPGVFAEFVRDERYKLYRDGEFFDIQEDPLEKDRISTNAGSAEANTARTRLQNILDQIHSCEEVCKYNCRDRACAASD